MELNDFQYEMLVDGIRESSPYHAFFLEYKLDRIQYQMIHDVFEAHDEKINNGEIFYQDRFTEEILMIDKRINVAQMVLAFSVDKRWLRVCRHFNYISRTTV
jgi:hypothetical protein